MRCTFPGEEKTGIPAELTLRGGRAVHTFLLILRQPSAESTRKVEKIGHEH